MSGVLSEQEVTDALARAEAATEGPWVQVVRDGPIFVADGIGCVVAEHAIDFQPDAAFIAAARTDVPALARSHEALRAERDRLRRVVDEYGQHKDDCEIVVGAIEALTGTDATCDCGFDQATYVALGLVEAC